MVQPRADRADRNAQGGGYLCVGQAVRESQVQNLPLEGRQRGDAFAGGLQPRVWFCGRGLLGRGVQWFSSAPLPAEKGQTDMPGDAEEICARRAHRLPAAQSSRQLQERFLDEVRCRLGSAMPPGKIRGQVLAAFAEDGFEVGRL